MRFGKCAIAERTKVEAQVDGEGLPIGRRRCICRGVLRGRSDPWLTQVMVPKGMASAWRSCTQMELVLQGEASDLDVPDADVSESGETYVRVPYEWMSIG
ncbi:MAG: hypothetical protein ACLVJ6_03615 [Merdibacter sp.]